jgi:hypothetical protein
MRYLLSLLVAASVGLALPASAQGCQRTSPHAQEDIEEVGSTFYDPEAETDRGTVIQLLTSADTAYVVRDDSTCQAIIDRAVSYLRQHHPVWAENKEGNYTATIYRFGPYYAVEVVPDNRSPAAQGELGAIDHRRIATVLIYRATDLVLLRLLA